MAAEKQHPTIMARLLTANLHRRVAPEDVAKCEERFNKSKMVHSIMRHVAETTHCDLDELYQTVAWPLYRIFGHAFDALKVMVSDDGDAIFRRLEEDKGAPIEILTPAVSDYHHMTACGSFPPSPPSLPSEHG